MKMLQQNAFHQPGNSINKNYNKKFYSSEIWKPHFHKNLEIVYVIKGKLKCIVNNNSYTLNEKNFGLCLPYEVHSYYPENDTEYWVCVFSGDYVQSFVKQMQGKIGGFVFDCKKSICDFVCNELIQPEEMQFFMLKSCLYALCNEYYEKSKITDVTYEKFLPIEQITEYISKNYMHNITLNDIATLLGYDYHYVSRLFHTIFNMPFKDFINTYRLDCAVTLLDTTDKKMLDIAYESGFQSVRSFNHCFFKRFHISPSEFKKALKTTN